MLDELQSPGLPMSGLCDGLGEEFHPVTTGFFDLDGSISADFPIDLSPLKSVETPFEGFVNAMPTASNSGSTSSDTDNASNGR